jgi:hypothetical protein
MFTVHFHKINNNNNNIQQMHFSTFITYLKYSYMLLLEWCFIRSVQVPEDGPWGPKHVGVFYICNKYTKLHLLDIIILNL